MRKIFIAIVALSACPMLWGKDDGNTVTPAADKRITYVGRTLEADGTVSFDWSAVCVRLRFEGDFLIMRASDTKKNFYDVWIDKEPSHVADKVMAISGDDSSYVLASKEDIRKFGTKGKEHRVVIKKRTEGEQGKTTIMEFVTGGVMLPDEGLKGRQFEVIGDSYTCGYGSESKRKDDPFLPETENGNLSYAGILARYFDADYHSISHSGMGITRNYADKVQDVHMPDRYARTFDCDTSARWVAGKSDFRPQISIIYLCTNDFSCGKQPSLKAFKRDYLRLLHQIADNYGEDHPVLCISSRCDDLAADYVRDAVNASGMENVRFLSLTEAIHDNEKDLGASYHPNYSGHMKIAHAIIPYVSTMTGWELRDDGIR